MSRETSPRMSKEVQPTRRIPKMQRSNQTRSKGIRLTTSCRSRSPQRERSMRLTLRWAQKAQDKPTRIRRKRHSPPLLTQGSSARRQSRARRRLKRIWLPRAQSRPTQQRMRTVPMRRIHRWRTHRRRTAGKGRRRRRRRSSRSRSRRPTLCRSDRRSHRCERRRALKRCSRSSPNPLRGSKPSHPTQLSRKTQTAESRRTHQKRSRSPPRKVVRARLPTRTRRSSQSPLQRVKRTSSSPLRKPRPPTSPPLSQLGHLPRQALTVPSKGTFQRTQGAPRRAQRSSRSHL
mmetsp:Transcript_20482/g.47929  ORF Transcript_20482/g.47929 Transcript_20482/m.47929 type:complete len:289 (+) Transcript_20482:646-1512(+)